MGVSENNILQTDFEQKETLAKKYQPHNGFVCQRKTICHQRFRAKKISPTPPQKSNGPLPFISAG